MGSDCGTRISLELPGLGAISWQPWSALFSRGGVNLCNTPVVFNPADGDCVRYLDQILSGSQQSRSVWLGRHQARHWFSLYNALGLSLERRFSQGLEFQARYTWSHSINDGSVGGGESSGPQNVNCLVCDKGPSIFDVRHNVTVNAVYELPFGPGKAFANKPGVLGKVVGGWQLSGISLWHTGHPETISMDLSGGIASGSFAGLPYTYLLPDGNDETTQRPDLVPGVPIMMPGGGHGGRPLINAAAFQAPPTDANGNFLRYGNAPNGVGRALNAWQIDMALTKETRITERTSLEFGVHAFNIFNHVQLGDPET